MATISAAGVGSGLDIQSIISQLMEIERQPLQRMQIKQLTYEAQISAYGQLSSSLSNFQSAMEGLSSVSALQLFKGTSSDPDVVTVTTSSSPDLGSFSVEVVRLAEQHKMTSKEVPEEELLPGL